VIRCQVEGLPELSKQLGTLTKNLPQVLLKGALVTARRLAKKAKENVPVLTGAGKRSIRARLSRRFKSVYLLAGTKRNATKKRVGEDAWYIAFHDQGTKTKDGREHVKGNRYFTEAAEPATKYLQQDVMEAYMKMSLDKLMTDSDIIAGTGTNE
jgi:hypothetical protein